MDYQALDWGSRSVRPREQAMIRLSHRLVDLPLEFLGSRLKTLRLAERATQLRQSFRAENHIKAMAPITAISGRPTPKTFIDLDQPRPFQFTLMPSRINDLL